MAQYSRRGRPAGSSRYNSRDNLSLRKAAERITLNPALRLTPALREIGVTAENDQRRLRRKWRVDGPAYLAEAKAREAELRYQQFMHGMRKVGDFVVNVVQGIDRAATVLTERYVRWADENPREAENLKNAMLNLRTLQIEAKSHRA